jgi:hypothetical protein
MKYIIGKQGAQGKQGVRGVQGFRGVRGMQGISGNGFFKFFVNISLVILLGALFLFMFWLVYPYKTVTFNKEPFRVLTPVIKRGENLIYEIDCCKYIKMSPMTARSFVDELIYNLPMGIATPKPLGCGVYKFNLLVPLTLPPDTYVLKTVYKYQVNPIREIEVVGVTEKFIVK